MSAPRGQGGDTLRNATTRPMKIAKWLFDRRACPREQSTFWHVVSTDPLIIYVQGWVHHVVRIHRLLAGRRAYLLRGAVGSDERPRRARRWAKYYGPARRHYPEHTVHFLVNSRSATDAFVQLGLPAVFCNQNGLLDERLFTVCSDVTREFDAVLNSQMEAVKRNELASEVESLAVITYRIDVQPEYFKRIRALLGHAAWLNFESGDYAWIPPAEMSRQLSRARVGLILSASEGANYATVEYLLSGLPVVSTRSEGGRDVFFDPDYVMVVDDDPAAVAAGVRELVARRLDPEEIRRRTLAKVLEFRGVFIDLVQRICDEAGVARDVRAEWSERYFNKLIRWQSLTALREQAGEGALGEARRELGAGRQ